MKNSILTKYIFLEKDKVIAEVLVDEDRDVIVSGKLPLIVQKPKRKKLAAFLDYRANSLGNQLSLDNSQTGILQEKVHGFQETKNSY